MYVCIRNECVKSTGLYKLYYFKEQKIKYSMSIESRYYKQNIELRGVVNATNTHLMFK